MTNTSSSTTLDLEALSGIAGSISIACWIVVFTPQIIENFRRKSADGLSVAFIVIWLVGDVFNILGAIMQRVLPTMTVLAVYYTLADVVLLVQVWWYRGFTFKDVVEVKDDEERRPLLGADESRGVVVTVERQRRHSSFSSIGRRFSGVDRPRVDEVVEEVKDDGDSAVSKGKSQSTIRSVLLNTLALISVCVAGVLGWWISAKYSHKSHDSSSQRGQLPEFDILGQIFGYLCAVLYLGSRVPQLLLNYRRQSTEGVSLLFFMFACIGNLTYDLSIFAYDPKVSCKGGPESCATGEARMIYARYIAVNASWIAGSLGTLLLDFGIFVQFFLYKDNVKVDGNRGGDEVVDDSGR